MAKTKSRSSILIVEDEAISRESIHSNLSKDYDVISVICGQDALNVLSKKPFPDLILLDVMMPVMDGYEVCRHIKSSPELKDIPVIFTTALASSGDESKGLAAGAADYVTKPINFSILKARINTHLELRIQNKQLQDFIDKRSKDLQKSLQTIKHKNSTIVKLKQDIENIIDNEDNELLKDDQTSTLTLSSFTSSENAEFGPDDKSLDLKWRSLIFYIQNLMDHNYITDGQKKRLQILVSTLVKKNDFSDHSYQQLIDSYISYIKNPLLNKLQEVNKESSLLLLELQNILISRKGDIKGLEQTTINSVASGKDPNDIISEIRVTFREVVSEMEKNVTELENICNIDKLTGLNNRRAFDDHFEREVNKSVKHQTPLSLLILDIDLFKQFNDTFGHSIGDMALAAVAKIILQDVKTFQTADNVEYFSARHGGEEFAIILSGATLVEAASKAETIRSNIENYNFVIRNKKGKVVKKSITITVSVGVAELNTDLPGIHKVNLFETADKALYQAKDSGRNLVICAN